MLKEQLVEHEKKPCLLCNDTGFVLEPEKTDSGVRQRASPKSLFRALSKWMFAASEVTS
jgi:hypothetical protein